MRSLAIAFASIVLLGTGVAVQERTPATELQTEKDKLSYALGMDLGKQLRQKQVDVDSTVFARGLADALRGGRLLLTDDESRRLVTALQEAMQRRELARVVEEADKQKIAGEAFLAANKKKEGVIALESGLQYRILATGAGRTPTVDDTVICRYRGSFIDGTEFDSSYSRGKPETFAVKNVIKGWREALQLMPTGSRWQLFVPSELAYGSRGAGGGRIAPNATLVYEVELVGIQ